MFVWVLTVPAVCLLLGLLECGTKRGTGWQMCHFLLLSQLRSEETVLLTSSDSACLLVHTGSKGHVFSMASGGFGH